MLIPFFHRIIRRQFLRQGIQSKTLELPSAVLHYYETVPAGSADTIVLVHGLGTSASTWLHLLPTLGRRFRILAPDLPGFGFSLRKNGFPFVRLEEYVETVKLFVSRVAPDRLTLLGHSLGGWITMRYAVDHPTQVKHLILINTAGVYYDGTEKQRQLFNLQNPRDTRRLLDHIWLRYPWYFRPFNPWVFEDLVSRNVPEIVKAIREEDFMNPSLGRLTMPVSAIWGMDDRLISGETLSILQREVPGLRTYTIDRCGHVPQLEQPGKLLQRLEETLGERLITGE